jgi:hypothetical protein
MNAPTPFDLTLEVYFDINKGPEVVKSHFQARKFGLICGWLVAAPEHVQERAELYQNIIRELSDATNNTESPLRPRAEATKKLLAKYGYEFDPELEGKGYEAVRYWETAYRIFAQVAEDEELFHRLETYLSLNVRQRFVLGWIGEQCRTLDTFRDGMLALQGIEGQPPQIEASSFSPRGPEKE